MVVDATTAKRADMKPSNFDGYVGLRKDGSVVMDDKKTTRHDKARGMASGFKGDKEGMRSSYETYKRDGDPDEQTVEKRLNSADESAAKVVQDAGRASDDELKREKRRGAAKGMADGGAVCSGRYYGKK